jgi:hypothetical protein
MVQGVQVVVGFIRRKFFVSTPRQEFEANQPRSLDSSVHYSTLCTTFLISMGFCVISPIVLPSKFYFFYMNVILDQFFKISNLYIHEKKILVGMLIFGFAFIIMKYQTMYVYENRTESGGTWWPKVFNLISIGVGFGQCITLTIVFAASRDLPGTAAKPWIALTPLPFLTAALWAFVHVRVAPRAAFMNREDAVSIDAYLGEAGSASSGSESGTLISNTSSNAFSENVFNPALFKVRFCF